MLSRLLFYLFLFFKRHPKILSRSIYVLVAGTLILLFVGKTYQSWDDDLDRGAVAIADGALAESYEVPEYLDQGWDEADSLWFYNTTQGSGLLPHDFFLVLEQPRLKGKTCDRNGEKAAWFLCDRNVDRFR